MEQDAERHALISKTDSRTRKQGEWLKPYQFQPGRTGNPAGRPKLPLSERLFRQLTKEGNVEAGKVVGNLLHHATSRSEKTANASVRAIEQIFDRIEGKVPQSVTGEGGGPLEVAVLIKVLGQ
jgi:hypothetical protein